MSLKENSFQFGDFVFDREQSVLSQDGKPLSLPPKALKLLSVLLENHGRIVEKEELLREVWLDTFVEEGNITYTVRLLRKILSDNPQQPAFIETVPKRGYRFIAEVAERSSTNGYQPNEIEVTEAASPENPSIWRRGRGVLIGIGLLIAAVGALGAWFLWSRSIASVPQSDRKMMLAVLPFQNLTGDEGQDYFSDGLTEEMITRLGNIDPNRLGVIARTSVMHFKNNPETIDQIGRELQVQYVLEGSVRRDANRVRVTAQLIQTGDQTHVWAREYDREITDLLSLQDEIAREVANNIQSTLGTELRGSTQISTAKNSHAYDLYLKGKYFFNERGAENLREAIGYFEQSSNEDPSFAGAYAGLAASFALLAGYSSVPEAEFIERSRAAAKRALEIDPDLSEAHTALALIVQNYDWDWQTAEAEFKRAIDLDPNNATAHHWYAEHLALLGRFDEALQESELARRLDPLSQIIATDNGEILYVSRQYDLAIQKLREVQRIDPSLGRSHIIIHAYVKKGMFKEAFADIDQWRTTMDEPWIWAELASLAGQAGRAAEAQRAVDKLIELNRHQPLDPSLFFWAYTGMGDKERALAWLQKSYDEHSPILARLKVDPGFDSLRTDPRFQDFLARVHLAG